MSALFVSYLYSFLDYILPPPLACTTLSGILSLLKWAISSVKTKSWMRTGPRGPTVNVAVLVPTGAPVPVVNTSGFYKKLIIH